MTEPGGALRAYTLLLKAEDGGGRAFLISYEVVAAGEEAAARFAIADLAARGERALDVEHVELSGPVNPLVAQGVRFRAGRGYFTAEG